MESVEIEQSQLEESTREQVSGITDLECRVDGWVLESPQEYQQAAQLLQQVKGAWKSLDEKEKTFTRPVNEALRRVRDWFRAPKDRLEGIEGKLKSALLAYDERESRLRRENERKAQEALKAVREKEAAERAAKLVAQGKPEEAKAAIVKAQNTPAPPVVLPKETPKVAGLVTRTVVKWHVIDESLIPDEYYVLDEKKIAGVVRALGLKHNIPGIEAWEASEIASRTASGL